jgi:hypothetical protein
MTVAETPIEQRFRLKLVPILVTVALGYAVPYIAGLGAFYSSKIFHTPSPRGPVLPWLYMQHGLQLVVALIVIAILKFRLVRAYRGDPFSRTVGHLSSCDHAGQTTYRPFQHELGRRHRGADLRAVAC